MVNTDEKRHASMKYPDCVPHRNLTIKRHFAIYATINGINYSISNWRFQFLGCQYFPIGTRYRLWSISIKWTLFWTSKCTSWNWFKFRLFHMCLLYVDLCCSSGILVTVILFFKRYIFVNPFERKCWSIKPKTNELKKHCLHVLPICSTVLLHKKRK